MISITEEEGKSGEETGAFEEENPIEKLMNFEKQGGEDLIGLS